LFWGWVDEIMGAQYVNTLLHNMPMQMTEPDLVHVGDGACIDDASLVAHINTRGNFELNEVGLFICPQISSR